MRIRAPAGPATPQVIAPFQALFFGGMAPDPLSGTWTGTRAAVVAYAVEMHLSSLRCNMHHAYRARRGGTHMRREVLCHQASETVTDTG